MKIIQLQFFDGNRSEGKRCVRCGEWMSIDEFHKDKGTLDGLGKRCKPCAIMLTTRSHHKDPSAIQRARRRYEENHREERNALGRLRASTNPKLTKEWHALLERFSHRCAACGTLGDLVPDHVVPLIRGGATDISNIQPLCHSCNCRKKDKTTDYR